jgi:Uma2 family endonuclease
MASAPPIPAAHEAGHVSIPESVDFPFEIVDGQRVVLPPMSAYASRIASNIIVQLGGYVLGNNLGSVVMETLFRLDLPVDRNRRPDVAFVSNERWPASREMPARDNAWNVVPDLSIEVVSPTDYAADVLEKVDEYFRSGVRQVWLVFPELQMLYAYDSLRSVRILGDADELDGGNLIPGMRLNLTTIFPKVEIK